MKLNARSISEETQGFNELQVLDLTDPGDLISRRTTAEAVVTALFGVHRKGRRLFPVKRAQSRPALARSLERHRLTDQRHDVGSGADLGDLALGYGHRKKVPVRP